MTKIHARNKSFALVVIQNAPSQNDNTTIMKAGAAPITIKYWPIRARASGLFRMLAEANIEYEHISDQGSMGCALWGDATSTNLAPPIVVDNETSLMLSQAVPCHSYIGNKYGFNNGITVQEVAHQYINDLSDLHSDMAEKAIADRKANSISNLQEYLTSDRYKNHLKAINRCIQGSDLYFGENPTYVDFAVCSYLDMCEGKWLLPLKEKSGDTIERYAPKLKAVYQKMKALPSAKKIDHLPLVPPNLVIAPERVAMWS